MANNPNYNQQNQDQSRNKNRDYDQDREQRGKKSQYGREEDEYSRNDRNENKRSSNS